MDFFDNICILCLIRNKNIQSILSSDKDGIIIEEKLKYIFSELLNFKPNISKYICVDCLKELNRVYKFKQKCSQNLIYLSNIVVVKVNQEDNNYDISKRKLVQNKSKDDNIMKSESDTSSVITSEVPASDNVGKTDDLKIEQEIEHINYEIDVKDILQNEPTNTEDTTPTLVSTESTDGSHKCNLCQKSFPEKRDLTTHKRTHIGEKLYQCDECDAAFSRNSHLVRHRRAHTGEKPYGCDLCDKAYSRKNNLIEHLRTHSGEKPFVCDVCSKGFRQKSALIIHKYTHR